MEEIFCKNCRYYGNEIYEGICYHHKNKTVYHYKNHYGRWKSTDYLKKPHELNENNDCKWFELKKWKKFLYQIGLGARL